MKHVKAIIQLDKEAIEAIDYFNNFNLIEGEIPIEPFEAILMSYSKPVYILYPKYNPNLPFSTWEGHAISSDLFTILMEKPYA